MTSASIIVALLALALGIALGAAVSTLLRRRDVGVSDTVAATSAVVTPVSEGMHRLEDRIREFEQTHAAGQATLRTQIESVRQSGEDVRREAALLGDALRKPHARGQWGEMHLRRTVEAAGLSDRVDFHVQVHLSGMKGLPGMKGVPGSDGALRPDMVVHLPGGAQVVVDSKVPLASFLEATDADDLDERAGLMATHARHVRTHIEQLASKRYWAAVEPTPEFVVMFLPSEGFFSSALEADSSLLEFAFARRVVPATPTTLVALLRTVALSWSQQAMAENAKSVFTAARDLQSRFGTFAAHLTKVGRSLDSSIGAYNAAVGSFENRLAPSLRQIADLDPSVAAPTILEPSTSRARPLAEQDDDTGVGGIGWSA
jgi:DNA recombination protein RmuC